MASSMNVGQTTALSIEYLDQDGKPMATIPTADSAPVWAQTTPATEQLVPAADGLTATAKGLAAGSDTIQLTVVVGGKTFQATLDMTVNAAAQVLTSVGIVAGPAA